MLASHYYEGKIEAGCDEAGRGCLAGSVYAAAVILPKDYHNELLNDSKQLTAKKRYLLREQIERDADRDYWLSAEEAKALRAGKTFGPELQGDEWYASRVAETRNVPDSLELHHVVVSYLDNELADSLYTVASKKGADFAALASSAFFFSFVLLDNIFNLN